MNERAMKAAAEKGQAMRGGFGATPALALPSTQPRQPIGHVLKCWPQQFQDIIEGQKPFTIRPDDRDFQRGDAVVLVEFDPEKQQHTGRSTTRVIGYLGRGKPYPKGYCAFMLEYSSEALAPMMATQGRLR